jgi:hypothetical protein
METEGSSPFSQEPATDPYNESDASHPISLTSIPLLCSRLCLGLPNGIFPSGFPTNTFECTSHPSQMCHTPRASRSPWFHHPNNVWRRVQVMNTNLHFTCFSNVFFHWLLFSFITDENLGPKKMKLYFFHIWGYIQKFPDWPPGTRIANGTALCH